MLKSHERFYSQNGKRLILVETEEQLQDLKRMGCDRVQGNYFSEPMPPERFEEYIKEVN